MKVSPTAYKKAVNPRTGLVVSAKGAKLKAWTAFARFVRRRDYLAGCITCQAPVTEAGHFLHNSDKHNQQLGGNELWYDEQNVHGQCGTCNRYKSGNGSVYSVRLVEMYGDGVLAELYRKFRTPRKWGVLELLDLADEYDRKYDAL